MEPLWLSAPSAAHHAALLALRPRQGVIKPLLVHEGGVGIVHGSRRINKDGIANEALLAL